MSIYIDTLEVNRMEDALEPQGIVTSVHSVHHSMPHPPAHPNCQHVFLSTCVPSFFLFWNFLNRRCFQPGLFPFFAVCQISFDFLGLELSHFFPKFGLEAAGGGSSGGGPSESGSKRLKSNLTPGGKSPKISPSTINKHQTLRRIL